MVEARLSREHEERAIQFSKAVAYGVDENLVIGRSQYADPLLVDALLSLHLPFHPNLNVDLHSEFAPELIQGVLTSRLDLALITHPGENPRLTSIKLSEAPLYIVVSEAHPLAEKESVQVKELAGPRWVVFDRRTHPPLHDTLMNLTRAANFEPRGIRHVMSAEEAAHLLARGSDVAFLTRAGALRIARHGFVARPLDEPELCLDAHLVARADNESKLVSEFVRTYVKQVKLVLDPSQMKLSLTAAVHRR